MTYKHIGHYLDSLKAYDDHTALVIKPFLKIERWTYAQLRVKAYQAAHYLEAVGVKSGDRIMIVAANSPQWVALFLGAQLQGIIVVPVDARNNLETTGNFIEQTSPQLIFRGKHLLPDLDKNHKTVLLDDLDTLTADYPTTKPNHELKGDETSVIVFTSGTTAAPKGVVLSQHNLLADVEGVQHALQIESRWRFLSVLPLSHMYELTGGCLTLLSGGASIYYLPRVTPLAIARGLEEFHITSILAVPQLVILFMQRIRQTAAKEGKAKAFDTALGLAKHMPWALRRRLFKKVHQKLGGCLEFVVTGGAPIPTEVARAWELMGVKMVQGYGLTETAPILTMNTLKVRRLDSQGMKLANVNLRIGEAGEIQASGPTIFKDYWQNKQATREAFTDDGWFKTGDVGKITNGWLQIQGRAKFAIVLSEGLKVFPEDVELVADKHAAIDQVCVVGLNKVSGEEVQAVIISKKSDKDIERAIAEINSQLESFQHISSWVRWDGDDFPRTRLLKIDRKNIQKWSNERQANPKASVEHTDGLHDPIVAIIRLSLDKPSAPVKEADVLADLGLDSLRRLTVVSLIEEQLALSIPESKITQHTTVADLRKLVSQGTAVGNVAKRAQWTYNPLVRVLGNGFRDYLLYPLISLWARVTITGQENIAHLKTPAIFIFNHVDGFDGPVIYHTLPKAIRNRTAVAVADDFLKAHKGIAFFIRFGFAGFNFARKEPYAPSLEYLAGKVDKGWNIVISPEGHISHSGQLEDFKMGIGLLAVELGVPVVPIKTDGLFRMMPLRRHWPQKRGPVAIKIGQPLTFGRDFTYQEVTKQLHDVLEEM